MDNWLNSDGAAVLPLFDDARGCKKFAQRLLRFRAGQSSSRSGGSSDEVLYVLDGTGTAIVGGAEVALRPGVGVFVRGDTAWSVDADGTLELLSVLVHDPEPASDPPSTPASVPASASTVCVSVQAMASPRLGAAQTASQSMATMQPSCVQAPTERGKPLGQAQVTEPQPLPQLLPEATKP